VRSPVAVSSDGARSGVVSLSSRSMSGSGRWFPRRVAGCAARPPPADVLAGAADTRRMRVSEFWVRLERQLGRTFAESWASDFAIGDLGGRTVRQALADGEDPKSVWRAVHTTLQLPDRER